MIVHDAGDERDSKSNVLAEGRREIGGILLAAGESARFEGGNKLLATVKDDPLVRRAAQTLLRADIDDVVVIVGHDDEAVRDALADLNVTFRDNEDYTKGQSTSVRTGVEVARERDWGAAVFALGDMPFVKSNTVDDLLNAYADSDGTIIAGAYKDQRGNPVLFDECQFNALSDVSGDRGGRRLIEEHEDHVLVETDDPGVTRDIDYEADLEKYTK